MSLQHLWLLPLVVPAQPRRFKVYEKAGTLRISVQDVKNAQGAKVALEGVVGVKEVA